MSTTAKVLLGFLGTLAVFGIWQMIRTQHYLNVGETLAKQAVPYEQHAINPTERILVIGDSTAVGTGASEPAESIAGLIGHDYPTADITNLGRNGARLADLPPRFATLADDQFDVVLVMAGGNDVWHLTPFTQIEHSLQTVLKEADRVGKHVIILHGGDFAKVKALPFGTRWIFSWRSHRMRDLYQRLVPSTGAHYVDLWDVDRNDPARAAQFYAIDQFHPSSSGYADWYEKIKPVISSLLQTNFNLH